MTKIIAFGHQKNVGKDTAAKFLNTALRIAAPHLVVKHISFAAKLKDICFQLYGWAGLKRGIYYETHYAEKEVPLDNLNGLTPRDIWIGVGNKLREIWGATWIDYALYGINADIIIISDLRFENEARAIKDADGILIKIVRKGMKLGTDAAETSLLHFDAWDKILCNFDTLDDLNYKMVVLSREILENIDDQN